MLKKIINFFEYSQKKDWDSIALKYFKNASKILDAGCGLGRFISQDPKRIVGIERNPANLELAKNNNYNIVSGDVQNIPFGDESFDGIYCSHVIEHLQPNELHAALKEFDRILKNGGHLIIISPLLWNHFYSDLTHVKPYNPDSIIHYMAGGNQRTKQSISSKYELINILWRNTPLALNFKNKHSKSRISRILSFALFIVDSIIYRLKIGFVVKKNGYMLIMKKNA